MNGALARLSTSAAATERLGAGLAPALRTGDVLALAGELGSGKTRFVAGLARALRPGARVRSPSFTLINEYPGEPALFHLDLYRLAGAEAEGLGLEEVATRGALAVEWGERLPAAWLEDALLLSFETTGENERRVTASAAGPGGPAGRGRALLEAWRAIAEPA